MKVEGGVSHTFGNICELGGDERISFALARISDDRKHYHKKATEIYYILSGSGVINLDSDTHEVRP